MASINMFFTPIATPHRRIRTAATAAKSSGGSSEENGGSSEEKGILDFILGKLAKEDQFYETDPILKKTEEKSTGTAGRSKSSVVVPPPAKKDGGFGGLGGLFAKK